MTYALRWDFNDLPEKLREFAHNTDRLPSNVGENPTAQAIRDYQIELVDTRRPTVSSGGTVGGVSWARLKPQGKLPDGTPVPVWGIPGKRKAKLKSEGVARGGGSRYKQSDLILGARAGGLWSQWITQKPRLFAGNRAAKIATSLRYAAKNFRWRSWFGPLFRTHLKENLEKRATQYLEREIEELDR